MTAKKDWFELWFDSPYYDILYKDRNTEEAQYFIDRLLKHLAPAPNATILDLACGAGRHSIYLASKGFEVTGIDLSEKNIQLARPHEHEKLSFFKHDIRNYFRVHYFNYIFNFFTSFGYFNHERDNIKTLRAANWGLKDDGIIVIDFLNSHLVIKNLVPEEQKTIDGVQFNITKSFTDGYIIKHIDITDGDKKLQFKEKVQALTLEDMQRYLDATGFELKETFGDYSLGAYKPTTSNRLILIAQKINA